METISIRTYIDLLDFTIFTPFLSEAMKFRNLLGHWKVFEQIVCSNNLKCSFVDFILHRELDDADKTLNLNLFKHLKEMKDLG